MRYTMGCPTLAVFLFLRLGWDTANADLHSVHQEFAQ